MATVFLAQDERLDRQVAVKRLHADSPEEIARRFDREAKVGASLNHPNIVSVYDTVTDEEGVLIVMEYVDGETLRDEIARGPLSPARCLEILSGVAAALDHAHQHGVVHRDVKPANVLIAANGTVKLADMGIAMAAERTRITHSGSVLGTAAYMAPERLDGHGGGPAVDVYALAAVAFEALSGEKAVKGRTAIEVARRVVTQPEPDLAERVAGTPPAAAAELKRAFAKEPGGRPASAGELVRGLAAAYAGAAQVAPGVLHRPAAVEQVARARSADKAPAASPLPSPREGADAQAPAAPGQRERPAGDPVAPLPGEGAGGRAPAAPGQRERPAGDPVAPLPGEGAGGHAPAAPGQRERPAGDPVAPLADEGHARPRRAAAARPRWIVPAALVLAMCVVVALIVALTSGGGGGRPARAASAGHSGAGTSQAHPGAPAQGAAASSGTQADGEAGTPAGTASNATPAGSATPTAALASFYTLPIRGDYNGAWALGTPSLHSQLVSFESWKVGEQDLKQISFPRLTVASQSANRAQVQFQSVAVHTGKVDHCTGGASLVKGATGWQIDQLLAINCTSAP